MALREGRTAAALAALASHGRLHLSPAPIEACAEAWWQARARHPDAHSVMLAYRRSEVAALNHDARRRLEAAGLRGARAGDGPREFAVGDWVRCRVNDPREGLRNGMRGHISRADQATGVLTLDVDDGTRIDISPAYQAGGGVEYGWAITGHAAQGITVDRAFVVAPGDGRHAEWGYVALSRARDAVHLFIAQTPENDGVDDVARGLRWSATRPLALTQVAASREQTPQIADDPPAPPHVGRQGPQPTRHHKATLTRGPELGR